ncbi:MAG: SDR family oxidoreductase [Bacteroidetes bacterium]|nr:SDR family oxidoreductase [Bacteroidota bacterium]
MLKIDLTGKNILVTGASGGIGAAIAKTMGACGARIGLHYFQNEERAKEIQKATGNNSKLYRADLADHTQIASLFSKVVSDFGQLHVIINNAGIALESDPAGNDMKFVDDWHKTMEVNLNAIGYLCKMAVAHFIEKGGGKIVNISSRAAFRGDTKEYLAYAASKGGIVSLTRSITRAYGKQGIVAFNIAPGFVRTDMAKDFIKNYGDAFVKNDLALDRLTEPEDIAPMVAFLASGMADHATGCTIDINAGSYVH